MPWVKLDDSFDAHKKARKAGLEALGLHLRALSNAGKELDDHVDREWVRERGGPKGEKLAQQLVEARLWETNGDGWIIHDFFDFNPTREEWDTDRAKRSNAAKRAASARWKARNA
jgi:hypothetical protein